MRAIGVFLAGLLTGWILRTMMADPRYAGRVRSAEVEKLVRYSAGASEAAADKPAQRTRSQPARAGRDDLTQIKGVGPAVEKKLRAAGLNTFSAIAALSAAELQELIGSPRSISAAGLVAQAKKLSRRK